MNQPAQALTFDQLTTIERGVFDAFSALSSALGNNLIIGFGAQNAEENRPALTIIFHGDKEEDDPRTLTLTVPENGPNFLSLLGAAGTIAQQVLNEYQTKTGRAAAHFIQADDVAKVRRNGKSKLILPRGN